MSQHLSDQEVQKLPFPGAGEGVTKPPAVGGGGDQARPDTPANRGLSAAEQKIGRTLAQQLPHHAR